MNIEMQISGLLFYCIIITNIASNRFGYRTVSDMNLEANLKKIYENQRDFKISFVLIVIEHICLILLAIMLFFAFNQYSFLLAIIWVIFRVTEGSIQIFNKKNYWKLLNIAKLYSGATGDEKNALEELRLTILKSKQTNFAIAQIFFSIGTLSYSILFLSIDPIPMIIGWFGIVASVLYGLGSGISLVKPDSQVVWNIGGLLIFIFEIILGGLLLISS